MVQGAGSGKKQLARAKDRPSSLRQGTAEERSAVVASPGEETGRVAEVQQVQPGRGVHMGRGERECVQGRQGGALCPRVQLTGQDKGKVLPAAARSVQQPLSV